jgi:hypothetical protein
MRRLLIALVLASVVLCAASQKKQKKILEISVVETAGHRTEGTIALDGRVRNTGNTPIEGLVILFDFMAPGGAVISTQKFPTEDEVLEVGQETVFRAQLNDEVRAVRYRISAVDRGERDVKVGKAGPYVIE